MTEHELNIAKYLMELRRLELDEKLAKRDEEFLYRNSTTLITGAISLAAIIVSLSGVAISFSQKEKELALQTGQNERAQSQAVFEANRKWRSDAANYVSANRELIFSGNTKDQIQIREVMILAYPPDIVDALFKGLEQQAKESEKVTWADGRKALDAVLTENSSAVSPQITPVAMLAPTSDSLVELFNGPTRRDVSNSLVREYAKDKKAVIDRLIATVRPEKDPSAYRVNLYVLFTLARIPGHWEGTPEQQQVIKALGESRNMADHTYAQWAKQANEHAK